MSWLDGLIPLSAVVFGAVAALAVSLVEHRGAKRERADALGSLLAWTWKNPVRPLIASVCTAALAAGAAAEFTTDSFGPDAQNHSVLVGTLTGAALLGITVLVIEALLQRVAAKSWQSSLELTWGAVVKAGRRGADDIAEDLGDDDHHVTTNTLPESRDPKAEQAYEAATRLQFEIGLRVDRASHAAFAAGQWALDDALHEAFTAADDLQRVLYRWSTGRRSRTAGAPRTPVDVEERWHKYLESLVRLHQRGLDLRFKAEMPENYHAWFDKEVAALRRRAALRDIAALLRKIAERELPGELPGA